MRNRETACNLTIIEEESCNISLKQDVIHQPVNNLMIFLSNQSILFSSYGGRDCVPHLCPKQGTKGTKFVLCPVLGHIMIIINLVRF